MRPAASAIRRWREKPQSFVREVFGVEPDAWQGDVLQAFPHSPRQALKACKGPGKTCVLAWLVWNYILTRPHPKIVCTSITGDNLADGLWTELAKWQAKSPLLKELFTWRKTRIEAKEAPETWWAAARTWPRSADAQSQADTLAGLHADYVLFVLDEAGGIPDSVVAAAEATLANVVDPTKQEAHLLLAGNPTHLEGPLYRACTTERHLWHITEITSDPDDPKRTPRVSIEWARQQIEKYGRDNPWVLVNVFGRFPPSSLNTLLGPDEVREAMQRHYRESEYQHAAKILGVDVARFGDDASCLIRRQGLAVWTPKQLRHVDSFQGGGAVARDATDWNADAIFVDGTGGYGAGWIDVLRSLGHTPHDVQFAGRATDTRFANKRAEMWWDMAQWVKDGGALPDIPELVAELTTPTYFFRGDKVQVEDKDQIKQRLGRSPDIADSLCVTFAQPVAPRGFAQHQHGGSVGRTVTEWDPLA